MSSFFFLPGAGTNARYWRLVVSELRDRGHDAVAVDLPYDDDAAGLDEYADVVIEAIGGRERPVVVAHSFGGFTAPLVCDRVPGSTLVYVSAMVPAPGEAPGDWWANTGYPESDDSGGDPWYHDVAPELAAEAEQGELDQSGTPMHAPWPLDALPDVPTHFVLCTEDRFFPAPYMRRVVRERLGIEPDEIASGHMPMLARPRELADRLEAYAVA
jgi:pimeloyl-ACP methyl ester carboxylesterase